LYQIINHIINHIIIIIVKPAAAVAHVSVLGLVTPPLVPPPPDAARDGE